MWPYHPDLLATPVPRYTSFPTAAEFGPEIDVNAYADALSTATGDVSLYVHIPFCEKICWYCGCNTAAANKAQRLATSPQASPALFRRQADLCSMSAILKCWVATERARKLNVSILSKNSQGRLTFTLSIRKRASSPPMLKG